MPRDRRYDPKLWIGLGCPLLVLSASTEAFDRGDKFKSYRQIKSLKEYILIDSKKKSVEQFYKDENGGWHLGSEITEGSMILHSFPIELSVDDIYFDVEFDVETA